MWGLLAKIFATLGVYEEEVSWTAINVNVITRAMMVASLWMRALNNNLALSSLV
jgi:hypothetical protein